VVLLTRNALARLNASRTRELSPTKFPSFSAKYRFAPEVARQLAALLDQQFWCWGCDIRRAGGNLLAERGFQRLPAPADAGQHSAYVLCTDTGLTLKLHGWGCLASRGGRTAFISRAKAQPVPLAAFDEGSAWKAEQLPAKVSPSRADLAYTAGIAAEAMRWFAGYEGWVQATQGADYRAQQVAAWPERRRFGGTPADKMQMVWEYLAHEMDCAVIE
jgi:hypothetical protein